MIELPRQNGGNLYIGDAGTLHRRAPSLELPSGARRVVIPDVARAGGTVGDLARLTLFLPFPPNSVRYFLPAAVEHDLGSVWRLCPTTGLDLPGHASDEAWYRAHSGFKTMVTPSELGVVAPRKAAAWAAWCVLLKSLQHGGDSVFVLLADMATRLDVTGSSGGISRNLADELAGWHRVGRGLVAAANAGRIWLNPRCLRWIFRELTAALYAAQRDVPVNFEFEVQGAMFLEGYFPGVLNGRAPSRSEVIAACWILHDSFHGADMTLDDPDGLGMVTALGYSSATRVGPMERLTSAMLMWAIPDNHWSVLDRGGLRPSQLRDVFRRETGVSVDHWLQGCLLFGLETWRRVEDSESLMCEQPTPLFGDEQPVFDSAFHRLLTMTINDFGRSVVEREEEAGGYGGLGSTRQDEHSIFDERPVCRLPNGSLAVISLDGLARVSRLTPEGLTAEMSGRETREVRSTLGMMFEGMACDELARLQGRHTVIFGASLDVFFEGTDKRADAVVATSDGFVAIEFGLQPMQGAARRGDPAAVVKLLERYAKKGRQALATLNTPRLRHQLQLVSTPVTGAFLVVDEPTTMSHIHISYLERVAEDVPPKFVIGIDDLRRLVALRDRGVDFVHALLSWQQGDAQRPFDHHLSSFERIVGVDRSYITDSIDRIVREHYLNPRSGDPRRRRGERDDDLRVE